MADFYVFPSRQRASLQGLKRKTLVFWLTGREATQPIQPGCCLPVGLLHFLHIFPLNNAATTAKSAD